MGTRARLIGMLVVCAALTGGLLGGPAAYAQGEEGDYVDVGIFLEVQHYITAGAVHQLDVVVVNNWTRTAYDVEVVLDVEYREGSRSQLPGASALPVGSATLDGTALRWTISALGGCDVNSLLQEYSIDLLLLILTNPHTRMNSSER